MSEMIPEFAELVAYERMANDEQYKWVITGWMNSYKGYWEQYHNPGWDGFYKIYRPKIIHYLEEYPPLIAVLRDDPNHFMSFCCGREGHLYYVYTKGVRRRRGLATKLIGEECGREPGLYHTKTFKRYFIRSLNQRGWKYEGEKEKATTNRKADDHDVSAQEDTFQGQGVSTSGDDRAEE